MTTVYKHRRKSQPLKWLVALIVFAVVMGIAMDDVYGIDPANGGANTTQSGDTKNSGAGNQPGAGGTDNGVDNPSPTVVPEPTTLLLVAGGLGALYLARRFKKI